MNVLNIRNTILTIKFPFRLFAFMSISFLAFATFIFTYKAAIETLAFIIPAWDKQQALAKSLALMIAFLIALATFVQSTPPIWNRLSHWGQLCDNFFKHLFLKEKYFLDAIEIKLKKITTTINQVNNKIQEIHWQLLTKSHHLDVNKTTKKIDSFLYKKISSTIQPYQSIINLLKTNEARDVINKQRKEQAENQLNKLIIQIIDTLERVRKLNLILNMKQSHEEQE